LTPTHLYSFKEEKKYKNPTEVIVLRDCNSVKAAEGGNPQRACICIVFWLKLPTTYRELMLSIAFSM
jgi:hypothetical protein